MTPVRRYLAGLIMLLSLAACDRAERKLPSTDQDSAPPLRLVTLAPHLAELVFAVGSGHLLVGVSAYTDFPDETAQLPIIGDAFVVDQEQLAILQPSHLLAWESGTPTHVVEELRGLGYTVETIRTRGLEDVGLALERIGRLTGRGKQGRAVASHFRDGLAKLRYENSAGEPIRVFYQVSGRPLYTINGEHFVSEIIGLCGGINVFEDLNDIAPLVSVEAVVSRRPEVMLAAGDGGTDVFADWRQWPTLPANQYGNHYFLDAGEIGRASPRLLNAAAALCGALDTSRENRALAALAQ